MCQRVQKSISTCKIAFWMDIQDRPVVRNYFYRLHTLQEMWRETLENVWVWFTLACCCLFSNKSSCMILPSINLCDVLGSVTNYQLSCFDHIAAKWQICCHQISAKREKDICVLLLLVCLETLQYSVKDSNSNK